VKLVDISGTKKKEYLQDKIDELETNSNVKNIRDLYSAISVSKEGYQPTTNIVRDEKGDFGTDSHSTFARWRNHFSQLFNVHGIVMLSRQKYKQQNHQCLSRVP
jgi:hypothetical protein